MMYRYAKQILIACIVCLFCSDAEVLSQPEPVPRLTVRALDKTSYVELAKEWKKYIDKHGETAEALVNLGMAYNYSGEIGAAEAAGKRAVEIEPDNPRALVFYAKMLIIDNERTENALEYLARARKIAPDSEEGLTLLAVTYMRRGELAKSEKVFGTIFDQKLFTRPLQDLAYNMLVGLPEGAVLITNGDNDTFPPLALQAGMGFRDDVIVLNRHLLNLEAYTDALFERYPFLDTGGRIEKRKGKIRSNALLERMLEKSNVPIYISTTVNLGDLDFLPDLTLEGLSKRPPGKGLSFEESARLFLDRYRMDSATDWSIPWDLMPSISGLMNNYLACMVRLAEEKELRADTRRRLLEKALEIAEFHENPRMENMIRSMLEE